MYIYTYTYIYLYLHTFTHIFIACMLMYNVIMRLVDTMS